MQRVAQLTGWTLIALGVHVALYLVYLLAFTGLETDRAQAELLEQWELEVGEVGSAVDATDLAVLPGEGGDDDGELPGAATGSAIALLTFEREGEDAAPVTDEVLSIVEGVSFANLRSGPGHYPGIGRPGGDGNFAISGHRTTYSAPFYDADQLQVDDLMHVVDRNGVRWTYRVVAAPDRCQLLDSSDASCIIGPNDLWVVGRDPLGTGRPLMTLTTCHPRFSASQRLVVFAELVTTQGSTP